MDKKEIIVLPEQADRAVVPINVDDLVAMVDAFDKFKSKVLKSTDFWIDTRENKKRVKKSGWLKYALACNVNLEKVDEREVDKETPPGSGNWVTIYHFDYRAIAQSGRFAEASGSASTSERKESDKMIHDTRSLAQTRALNRAISNLIGGGEVSAEEVRGASRRRVESDQKTVNKPPKRPKTRKTRAKAKPEVPEEPEELKPLPIEAAVLKVRKVFEVNALDIGDFTIFQYEKTVTVKPPKDIDMEDWDKYNTVMEREKAPWDQEAHQWTVPIEND